MSVSGEDDELLWLTGRLQVLYLNSSLSLFASYYRHFVEGFAKLDAPLHKVVADLAGKKNCQGQGVVLKDARTLQCDTASGLVRKMVVHLLPNHLLPA